MAFLAQENSLCINCDDDFNNALLLSFLEESPCEEYDHEELDNLMRSLEAEINPIQDLMMDLESLSDGEESHGSKSVDLDFQWGDLEPTPSPSPSHGMNWYMDTRGEEVDALIEIGDDYSDMSFDDVLHGQTYTTLTIEADAIEMYS